MKTMRFEIPTIWRKPTNHVDDCYFCITPAYGFTKKEKTRKKKHKVQYSSFDLAIFPVPHSNKIPVLVLVKLKDCDDLKSSFVSEVEDMTDPDLLDIFEVSTS